MPPATELPPATLARLDELPASLLVEYLAARLGATRGAHWLRFLVTDGRYREGGLDRTRIRAREFDDLARPVG